MNLISTGVMTGLVGASASMKHTDVSMRVYRQAENEGDEAKMKRALDQASDSIEQAGESSREAQDALSEAKDAARAENKKAAEENAVNSRKNTETTAASDVPSSEGRAVAPASVAVDAAQATDALAAEPKFYTPEGGVKTAVPASRVSVSI
jgi:hypothetical protein